MKPVPRGKLLGDIVKEGACREEEMSLDDDGVQLLSMSAPTVGGYGASQDCGSEQQSFVSENMVGNDENEHATPHQGNEKEEAILVDGVQDGFAARSQLGWRFARQVGQSEERSALDRKARFRQTLG